MLANVHAGIRWLSIRAGRMLASARFAHLLAFGPSIHGRRPLAASTFSG